ncbi:sigma-70 family RNA polymerase sigma factor [Halomonas denitrificans]|nr:sigma-70 family RNA polymerase sigma factor [Halomonas denitrificans]
MDASVDDGLDLSHTVPAAAGGDRAAFERLYRRYAPGLVPVLWRLAAGDEARAEDWLQDAFVQAWGRLGEIRRPQAFPGWIRRLAINVALADRRRAGFRVVDARRDAAGPEPPWPGADLDLERAIARLPDRARQVLVLFHLCDLSHAEIAEVMTIETGTSKAQLSRARSLLKEMLA